MRPLAAFLLGVALTAVLAAAMNDFASLFTKETWPAWVQAIGSVFAVAVAIAVPAWQTNKQLTAANEQNIVKAQALALLIYADVHALIQNLRGAAKIEAQMDQVIGVPEVVEAHLAEYWLFGRAGGLLTTMVATMRQQNRIARIVGMRSGSDRVMAKLQGGNDLAKARFEMAANCAEEAVAAMDRLLQLKGPI